jgi:hypothetical protein
MAAPVLDPSEKKPLQSLEIRFAGLREELNTLQSKCLRIKSKHHQLCSSSLREALSQLFEMMRCVSKADKALVDWHHRSKGLKLTLKLIGLERRTEEIVRTNTDRIKYQVSYVETIFNNMENTFGDGLEAAKRLNERFKHFSHTSIRDTSYQAKAVCRQYGEDCKQMETAIEAQEIVKTATQAELTSVTSELECLQSELSAAQGARTAFTIVSLGKKMIERSLTLCRVQL